MSAYQGKLMKKLPEYYQKSAVVEELQKALELADAAEDIESLLAQCFVETATWSLSLWEKAYGIETDPAKSDALRRTAILAKMRGSGTSTVALLQNVAESFVNGEVSIVEHNDRYAFDVKMESVIGIPPNMEDLRKAIEEIKPAHLAYEIILKYNTWQMAEQKTWNGLAGKTWTSIREEAL